MAGSSVAATFYDQTSYSRNVAYKQYYNKEFYIFQDMMTTVG